MIFDAAAHPVEFWDTAAYAVRQYQQVIPLQRAYQPSIYHTAAATIRSVIVETRRRAMSVEISSTVFGKN